MTTRGVIEVIAYSLGSLLFGAAVGDLFFMTMPLEWFYVFPQ